MADIRIKDLTTTASSTASDDFIAVDGATNGTRKLNAYSPSFGGNVTVAGTLNVGGTLQLANNTALQFLDSVGTSRRTLLTTGLNANYFGAIDAGWGGPTDIRAGTSMFLRTNGASGTFVDALTITNNGIVSVPTTFASTSTSTGALVVSGGVGVAKEVYVGKTCKVGTGSDNEGYTNVFTNKAENTAGPFDITLPSDCVGVVFLNSHQGGVGRSFREIPFICFGGTVTLGTSRTTVLTADPVTSVAAAASSKITISLYAANTNCYWGIYVNKS
jgi:hypothetical protein